MKCTSLVAFSLEKRLDWGRVRAGSELARLNTAEAIEIDLGPDLRWLELSSVQFICEKTGQLLSSVAWHSTCRHYPGYEVATGKCDINRSNTCRIYVAFMSPLGLGKR